jgi:hypothetical protein
MAKSKEMMLKLMSNLFFKTIACLSLLMFGAVFVKFSSSFATYARDVDYIQTSNNQFIMIDNTVFTAVKDKIFVSDLSNSINYITATVNDYDIYPENWINEFNEKIIELQNVFPNGKYWNHMGQEATNPGETNNIYSVTDIPCNHYEYGELYCNAHYGKSNDVYPYMATCSQCRGFASLLSDLIFGEDAPVRYFEDYDELRIGDQARIDGDYHSVFIIDKTDEYVIVAECNSDLETCKIQWGRKILKEELEGWYISRWDSNDSADTNNDNDINEINEDIYDKICNEKNGEINNEKI